MDSLADVLSAPVISGKARPQQPRVCLQAAPPQPATDACLRDASLPPCRCWGASG